MSLVKQDHILFSHEGHAAYDAALEKYGDVVIVPRHGRMEYVLDVQHVRDVLTDAKNFSFEKAVTSMMHMEFMLWFKNGTFVQVSAAPVPVNRARRDRVPKRFLPSISRSLTGSSRKGLLPDCRA